MLDQLSRNWPLVALRGIVAVLFAIYCFAYPGASLAALMTIFGVFACIEGVVLIVTGLRSAAERNWLMALQGLAGIVFGVMAVSLPILTAMSLLVLISAWAIISGVIEMAAAVRLRKEIEHEWIMGFTGAVSVLLGLFLLSYPGAGLIASVWMIGVYAGISGVLLLALAVRLRTHRGHKETPVGFGRPAPAAGSL